MNIYSKPPMSSSRVEDWLRFSASLRKVSWWQRAAEVWFQSSGTPTRRVGRFLIFLTVPGNWLPIKFGLFFLRSCCVDGKLTLWIRVFNCKFHRSRKSHAKPLCRSFAVEGRLMWIFLDFHAEENWDNYNKVFLRIHFWKLYIPIV